MIKSITALFFGPTGNTGKVTQRIAGAAGECLGLPVPEADVTLPQNRAEIC